MYQQHPTDRAGQPRVCALVVMNHPFPSNLPLLRRLYADRFTHVRFVIPFERMDDPDVLTVYRGSYHHAAYLNDIRSELAALDCDYYLVIHDDVLLNPYVSEATFTETFALAPNDGFIPHIDQGGWGAPGRWVWSFAFVPKLLHPKSLLFGSGVEIENLVKYLPDGALLTDRLKAHGLTPTTKVQLNPGLMDDVARTPSRMLLHGLAARLDMSPEQLAVEAGCLEIAERLIAMMGASVNISRGQPADQVAEIELPIPVVRSGYFTDFYILPRSGLQDFCHYIGVASAAGLFVEIIAPTLLHACCERVRTADEVGLDFGGFDHALGLDFFEQREAIAIHPFKLSAFRDPVRGDALLALLESLRAGEPISVNAWDRAGLKPSLKIQTQEGCHAVESWGFWTARTHATFRVRMISAGPVTIKLRAPLAEGVGPMAGTLRDQAGGGAVSFSLIWPKVEQILVLNDVEPEADGWANLELTNARLLKPNAIDPTIGDMRDLGVGVCRDI